MSLNQTQKQDCETCGKRYPGSYGGRVTVAGGMLWLCFDCQVLRRDAAKKKTTPAKSIPLTELNEFF